MIGNLLDGWELRLLCEFAERPWPLPLTEPSSGAGHLGRPLENYNAARALESRGLADERGPLGAAADVVAALREGILAHLVLGGPVPVAASVLRHRGACVVLVQRASWIEVLGVARDPLPNTLLSLIPKVDAASTLPMSLPREAVDAVKCLREQHLIERVLADHGVGPAAQQHWVTALHPVLSNGQFGTRPDNEVRWVDSGLGRLRLTESDGWISANPMTEGALRSSFREILHRAR
ncbi:MULTISPECIES: ESX secretion-associated protein EspG [Actinosynnema]|uniref:ESX secretion-associated protein EspG n=1 Tax=Actinosynnema TaxID=40566 RepID=UPI0020A594DB|nr:ESX secretion-associated protein EspG [Actinosynnema pretiosum]MCP2092263.1 EspG family protein [Actinosynnema pretiosum]